MSDNFIPVFVFPNCLKFNLSDQTTYKQTLTLYNPYDYPVTFEVLCSSKDKHKYSVVHPKGKIQTQHCVDIVVRHNATSRQNIGQLDKFRIQMFQYGTNKMIGRKDITAELLEDDPERAGSEEDSFQQLPNNATSHLPAQYSFPKRQTQPHPPNGLFIGLAILCATTLLLPTTGEVSAVVPEYLKPSVYLKLVVSYVLGLVTMALFKST